MRATGLKRLAPRTDWDQCMAAIDNRSRMQTIRKLAKQMDYRKARDGS